MLMIFPSPAGMSLTKLSLGGNYDVIYKLFPSMESLVSDIPAGDGKMGNLFSQIIVFNFKWVKKRFGAETQEINYFCTKYI
jgi:hypothetical protein